MPVSFRPAAPSINNTQQRYLTDRYPYRPISTYSRQGVAKPDIDPGKHSAICIRGTNPAIGPDERGMKATLYVVPDIPKVRLDGKSRLNFGTPHNVHYNWKVSPLGRLSRDSRRDLHSFASDVMRIDSNIDD